MVSKLTKRDILLLVSTAVLVIAAVVFGIMFGGGGGEHKEPGGTKAADTNHRNDQESPPTKTGDNRNDDRNQGDSGNDAEQTNAAEDEELLQSLMPNPGFEQADQSAWTGRGSAKVAVTDEKAYSGKYSLKTTNRTTTWAGPAIDLTNVLEKGKRYYFSLKILYTDGPLTRSFNLQFETHTGGQVAYPGVGQTVATKNRWETLEGEFTIPDDEQLTRYVLYVEVPWKPDAETTDDDRVDFYIDHIIIQEIPPITFQTDIKPLKEVLKPYFPFGVATVTNYLDEKEIYADFMAYHYNVLVAGNAMKPDAMQPTEGNFNWREADQYLEFAEKHGMLMRGHTLVWHNQVPGWFFTDPNDSSKPATSEQLLARLENHIKTIVGRYKGRVHSWDVVNEVISDSSGLRGDSEGSKWKAIVGDVDGDGYDSDYIEYAFRFAREADPDAKLIINDYGLESSARKRNDMYELVKRMLEKGVPVDGVGLQMHISIYGPTPREIEETIELFASLKEYNPDFTVEVTEMDMSVYRWMEQKKEITDSLLKIQADRYGEIFDVFRRQAEKGNLSMVVMWGMGDNDSWLENFPIAGRGDAGLLFDKRLQAKPAYWAIVGENE